MIKNAELNSFAPGNGFDSWADVQDVVRRGFAPQLFPVGSQFKTVWKGSPYKLDVVDNDYTVWTLEEGVATSHSALALMWHNSLPTAKEYDAKESNATLWGFSGDGVKTFADLATELYTAYPNLNGETFRWHLTTREFVAYSTSTDVTEEGVTYLANSNNLGSGASNLMNYGNGANYICNIMQWLNADGVAGEWFLPSHVGDGTPSYANTEDGFLHNLDSGLKNILVPCTIAEEGLTTPHTIIKIHLPVLNQINGNAEYYFDYYGTSPTNTNRIKKRKDGVTVAWQLNSYGKNIYQYYCVASDGSIANNIRATSAYCQTPIVYIF